MYKYIYIYTYEKKLILIANSKYDLRSPLGEQGGKATSLDKGPLCRRRNEGARPRLKRSTELYFIFDIAL